MKYFRFILLIAGALLANGVATAADLALSGIVGGKAVLVVDNKPPQLLSVGKSTPDGVRLIAIEGDVAVVEFDGRRFKLRLGARVVRQSSGGESSAAGNSALTGEAARKVLARGLEITIEANDSGQFLSAGEINGTRVSFLVDTGASSVALGRSTARQLGFDLRGEPDGQAHTAGGVVKTWRITLKSVKIGGLRFEDVEAMVSEADMQHVLLGMNVLDQMEMRRSGRQMYLKKKL